MEASLRQEGRKEGSKVTDMYHFRRELGFGILHAILSHFHVYRSTVYVLSNRRSAFVIFPPLYGISSTQSLS